MSTESTKKYRFNIGTDCCTGSYAWDSEDVELPVGYTEEQVQLELLKWVALHSSSYYEAYEVKDNDH